MLTELKPWRLRYWTAASNVTPGAGSQLGSTAAPVKGRRQVAAPIHVSPTRKYGVPSAYWSAWPLGAERRNPRRLGFACLSASVQSRAAKLPDLRFRPVSADWLDPLVQVQVPGWVSSPRTRNISPP